jgi:hypothetical protein
VNRVDPSGNLSFDIGLGIGTLSFDSSLLGNGSFGFGGTLGPSLGLSFNTGTALDPGLGFSALFQGGTESPFQFGLSLPGFSLSGFDFPSLGSFSSSTDFSFQQVQSQVGDEGIQIAGRGRSPLPRPPPPPPPGGLGSAIRAGASLFARIPGFLAQAQAFRSANTRLENEIRDLRTQAREGNFRGRNVAAFKVFILQPVPPPLGGARVIESNLVVFDRPAGDIGAFIREANEFARREGAAIGPSGPMITNVIIGPIKIAGPPPRS